MGPIKKRQGANLPHWTAAGASYFVTFRLGDSLPQSVVTAYQDERKHLLAARAEGSAFLTPGDTERLHKLFEERIERYLDAGAGACWLKIPKVADLVQDALQFFHAKRYYLHAWAVMPNHVHVVVEPSEGFGLSDVLHSWKSFTSKEANKLIGRKGEFWQPESWDHLVRDQEDHRRCVAYVLANPEKAGCEIGGGRAGNSGTERPSGRHRRDADATNRGGITL